MIIDVVVAVWVIVFFVQGRNTGGMAAVYRVSGALGALTLAKFLCKPTSNAILKGVAWSPQFSQGLCFLVYFALLGMVARFALGALIREAELHGGDGGQLDRGMGALLNAARGALIAYGVLAATILMTHRLGARVASLALPYHGSYVGRFVLGWNIADPEVFPNAFVLRAMVGLEENSGPHPEALEPLREWTGGDILETRPEIASALAQSDWKTLRKSREVLELVCQHEFLKYADLYYTPSFSVTAENPEDRFNELKSK